MTTKTILIGPSPEEEARERLAQRKAELEAELEVLRRLDQKLEGADMDLWICARPGSPPIIQARVGREAFTHRGSATVALARLLNMLERQGG